MSDQDEPKANERDSNEDRKSDPESESAREPARESSKKAATNHRSGAKTREPAAKAPAGIPSSRVAVLAVLALLAGGAAGWFGHAQQAKAAALKADAAPVDAATGPCSAWEQRICADNGAESAACMQAKGAAELLTPSTCEVALTAMPATVAKLKAMRAPCDNLVSKLCADLPPGSQTCTMVKEKTPMFPAQRCDEMLTQYDQVLAELRQLEEQGGMMGGPGGPPGMPPHGMPPQ